MAQGDLITAVAGIGDTGHLMVENLLVALVDEIVGVLAENLVSGIAEHVTQSRINVDDSKLGIEHPVSLGGALDQALIVCFAFA